MLEVKADQDGGKTKAKGPQASGRQEQRPVRRQRRSMSETEIPAPGHRARIAAKGYSLPSIYFNDDVEKLLHWR